jgi:prolipoprotein diacylglyceryltransferase
VQLVEALLLALLAALLVRPRRAVFASYLIAYSLIRGATEALRGDELERGRLLGGPPSQLFGAFALAAALALLYRSGKRGAH